MTPLWLIATSAIKVVLNERHQILTRWKPRTQQGKPWRHSAPMPQGGLADKRNKCVVRALLVSEQNSFHDNNYYCRGVKCRDTCASIKTLGPPPTESLGEIGQIHALGFPTTNVRIKKNKLTKKEQSWHVERASCTRHSQHKQCKQVDWQRQGHRHQTTRWAQAVTTTTATPYYCPKPSDQPRDAARREECSDLDEKSLTTFCSLSEEGERKWWRSLKWFYET